MKNLSPNNQVKTKRRVVEHGEVFTAEREVNAMLDLVKPETERVDSRFLEPACGNGNFLAEILRRKLTAVTADYKKSLFDWEKFATLAACSIYGIDILQDNVLECRERLFEIWNDFYKKVAKKNVRADVQKSVKFVFSLNIVCGNALSMKQVDAHAKDTNEPIVFPEWTNPKGRFLKRQDFLFDVLLKENKNLDLYEKIVPADDEDVAGTDEENGVPAGDELFAEDVPALNLAVDYVLPRPIKNFDFISFDQIWKQGELL